MLNSRDGEVRRLWLQYFTGWDGVGWDGILYMDGEVAEAFLVLWRGRGLWRRRVSGEKVVCSV